MDIKLDQRGVNKVLRETVEPVTRRVAELVADSIDVPEGTGITRADIKVRRYSTDRTAYSVDVEHPEAMQAQLEHGILTRAAAKVGIDVRDR